MGCVRTTEFSGPRREDECSGRFLLQCAPMKPHLHWDSGKELPLANTLVNASKPRPLEDEHGGDTVFPFFGGYQTAFFDPKSLSQFSRHDDRAALPYFR